MKRRRLIIVLIGLATVIGSFVISYTLFRTPSPTPVACTMEARRCPDGSYVGRTGPHCEFAPCPAVSGPANCTSDVDCASAAYGCEAIEGVGTAYPNNAQPPSYRIIKKGVCKLEEGNACRADADCLAGLVCHAGRCANPRGKECNGPADKSCPDGYRCVQACGPPVVRIGEPSPPYYCEVDEVAAKPRICPICLASNTEISTPDGPVNVKEMKAGMRVWSMDDNGKKVASTVVAVTRTPAPKTHQVVHLVLSDARSVWASPNHPTADGIPVAALRVGDSYDGARVESVDAAPYWDDMTYDLLPDSATGDYWANGILLGSTLASPTL